MSVPSTSTALSVIARLALRRAFRRKAVWFACAFALLPTLAAVAAHGRSVINRIDDTFTIARMLLAIIPPLLVGAAIDEEIEDRTATYLWSRPLARWTVVIGKLIALSPLAVAIVCASWLLVVATAVHGAQLAMPCFALAVGALACSQISASLSVLVPKHGMALSIVYLATDAVIGLLPTSLGQLSVCYHVLDIARRGASVGDIAFAVAAIAAISGIWLAVGLNKVRRVEV